MRNFKEQLEKDFDSTFFSLNEFAENHLIDDVEMPVVIDNDMIINLFLGKSVDTDGIFTDDKVFFVQKKYLGYEPVAGQHMKFDAQMYPVKSVFEDIGGYTIVLSSNED